MVTYCLDASSLLSWALSEPAGAGMQEFWQGLTISDEVAGPPLLLSECTSVLREKVYEGVLLNDQATRLMDVILALPIEVEASSQQFRLALEFAHRLNRRKAYDMLYLAVASLTDSALVTADRGMFQAASQLGIPARLIE